MKRTPFSTKAFPFTSKAPHKKKGGLCHKSIKLIRNGEICLHPIQNDSEKRLCINSSIKEH